MPKALTLRKRVAYALEALALLIAFTIFRLLPLSAASFVGGWIARRIGPFLRWHRVATANLAMALPEYDSHQREHMLRDMWDNLGRTLAEYPWLGSQVLANRIRIDDESRELLAAIAASEQPILLGGGHFANWELIPLIGALYNIESSAVYRHINNPYIDRMIYRIRSRYAKKLYPKGKKGAVETLRAMRDGGSVGLLIDQKMNDGVSIPFFNHPAMTAPAIADLALKYNAPIFLVTLRRMQGCHFQAQLIPYSPESPFTAPSKATGDDRETILTTLNAQIEAHIRTCPAQWLWVHQRWGKVKV